MKLVIAKMIAKSDAYYELGVNHAKFLDGGPGQIPLDLKVVAWHGLTKPEPLVYEKLILALFENPDRKKFPRFLSDRG